MDRRQFLQSAAAASALGSLFPVYAAGTVKVAVMIPQSGPAGLFGPSAKACASSGVASPQIARSSVSPECILRASSANLSPT